MGGGGPMICGLPPPTTFIKAGWIMNFYDGCFPPPPEPSMLLSMRESPFSEIFN
jgi:hypothetical protein